MSLEGVEGDEFVGTGWAGVGSLYGFACRGSQRGVGIGQVAGGDGRGRGFEAGRRRGAGPAPARLSVPGGIPLAADLD